MKHLLLFFQFVLTLLILALVSDNVLKVALLLPMWWLSFGGLNRKELISFFIINLIFIISDIGAITNGFFRFHHPDLFGLPYWEFFMWGFFLLHTHRFLPAKAPLYPDLKLIIFAIVFSQLFGVISDRNLLLVLTGGVLILTLFFYSEKEDFLYCGYLMLIGSAMEYVGVSQGLWSYPERDYQSALVQFVVMWGAVGVYFRHILGGWLVQRPPGVSIYKKEHILMDESLLPEYERAKSLHRSNETAEALKVLTSIEASARKSSLSLNFEFYIRLGEESLTAGELRKSVNAYREALNLATNPVEKASIYLQLARVYRMMILMKNARLELKHAFDELRIEMPTDSVVQTLRAILSSFFIQSSKQNAVPANQEDRRSLEVQVALYEETGLSAYYFLDYRMLLQCSLRAKRPASQLGKSLELLNWVGGSACVWAVLGWKSKAKQMIQQTVDLSEGLGPQVVAKAQMWKALYYDYSGNPQMAATEFETILNNPQSHLSSFDLRLVSTTLSCNQLLRGQMRQSEESIRNYLFSRAKIYVDWYRLPALSFLGEKEEAQQVLKSSQFVFCQFDEEKWQITQFLGSLLIYYYTLPEKNMQEIRESLERFNVLHLSPQMTYLEASQIWVGKAHLFIDLAREKKVDLSEALDAVRDLGRLRSHPTLQAHFLIATAKIGLLESNPNFVKLEELSRKASDLAKSTENQWVEYEVLKFEIDLKRRRSQDASNSESRLRDFCTQHGWKGMAL